MQPANIEDHLPLVMEGLRQVQKKNPTEGTAEEVIEACKELRAFFFVNPEEGFLILKPTASNGETAVHVWIAYSKIIGFNKKYIPFIEDRAREIGATKITTNSTRKAYRRLLTDCKREGSLYTRYL